MTGFPERFNALREKKFEITSLVKVASHTPETATAVDGTRREHDPRRLSEWLIVVF